MCCHNFLCLIYKTNCHKYLGIISWDLALTFCIEGTELFCSLCVRLLHFQSERISCHSSQPASLWILWLSKVHYYHKDIVISPLKFNLTQDRSLEMQLSQSPQSVQEISGVMMYDPRTRTLNPFWGQNGVSCFTQWKESSSEYPLLSLTDSSTPCPLQFGRMSQKWTQRCKAEKQDWVWILTPLPLFHSEWYWLFVFISLSPCFWL